MLAFFSRIDPYIIFSLLCFLRLVQLSFILNLEDRTCENGWKWVFYSTVLFWPEFDFDFRSRSKSLSVHWIPETASLLRPLLHISIYAAQNDLHSPVRACWTSNEFQHRILILEAFINALIKYFAVDICWRKKQSNKRPC